MKEIDELVKLLQLAENATELKWVLSDLLTDSEITAMVERWKSVCFLLEGKTHREVQQRVGISISKVTHAANLLKKDGKGFRKMYLRKNKNS